ncbi:hypothetical protein WOLCODRAFT_161227 [Wolfiporia cocos MD-104 SS10]|uniref:Uncharacterized protein n=1 Tax=Wolfiporia cocos (strain MD-104) TaxID=742152 RepID=A0A2H3JDW4_WOLCO|nr:hypothetical protein WOLCODRAFT_161227 [Wolfiporia cocos MD-104 SS10]
MIRTKNGTTRMGVARRGRKVEETDNVEWNKEVGEQRTQGSQKRAEKDLPFRRPRLSGVDLTARWAMAGGGWSTLSNVDKRLDGREENEEKRCGSEEKDARQGDRDSRVTRRVVRASSPPLPHAMIIESSHRLSAYLSTA